MAKEIKLQEDALIPKKKFPLSRRYIYFDKPPALWEESSAEEGHEAILIASGRNPKDIRAIGFSFPYEPRRISFDNNGSFNLRIQTQNAKDCVKYVKSLPTKQRAPIKFKVAMT